MCHLSFCRHGASGVWLSNSSLCQVSHMLTLHKENLEFMNTETCRCLVA